MFCTPLEPVMANRNLPPTRKSISHIVSGQPTGPNHFITCSGLLIARKTMRAGASKVRVMTTVRSAGLSLATALADIRFLLGLQFLHVGIEPVEALLPETAVVADPFRGVLERGGVETDR